ncbi:lytic transglycosylase domain-containing protein [Azovibrio restrictus]|uniref:lytic transglycosylase domain-containing protein n=1 Tax=Azovibrio restrictus TaxID=146938 RepID=UPI0026EE20D7|nr:lytic transglycosylase domain-containing protein [Azovibrio restrictus]
MKLRPILAGLGLVACLAAPLQAQEMPGDTQFVAAREAFRVGNRPRLEALAAELRGHPLADYADYYLLRQGIEQQDPAAIQAFIQRQTGNYLGERLRTDWLRVLAKREDWQGLLQHYAQLKAPDQEARCLAIQARLQLREAAALAEGESLWLTLHEVPEGCRPLMTLMADKVSTDQLWARVRLLVEMNKLAPARQVLATLPPAHQPDPKQLDLALDKAAPWLARLSPASLRGRTDRELVALAIQRLSRNDPAFAAEQLERWGSHLGEQEKAWAWGQIGLQAARRHMDHAGEWFRRSQPALLSDEGREWQVRAALRSRDWVGVRRSIESMPAGLQEKPEWVYWLGRAYQAGGRQDQARQLFERIAGQPSFYGNLADEELGRRISIPPRAQPVTPQELAEARAHPGLTRALAFFRLDMRLDAIREWNWSIRDMDDRQLLAAAELAQRHQIYDRAINTADRTRNQHDYTLRFLAPFDDQVRPAARQQALDEAWVYGLMRQESRFITNARSSVGASGLMQLMPATAKWVARKIGLKDYDHRRVNDPEINLLLGTTYMRMVMEDLDNHPVLASAAYNAGPGRARKWRAEVPLEGAIYAETIPFSETRDYVKKVMSNAVYYSVLFNGQPASLRARLGMVPARPAVDTPKTPDLP